MPVGYPTRIADDSHDTVAWNGTEGLGGPLVPMSDVVRRVHADLGVVDPATGHQPRSGRRTWVATTMTSQAMGTAAKNPSAALQPLRRRTLPEPVGCGTMR